MTIPKNINTDHIIKAIQKIEIERVPDKRESTRFNLSYEGKNYPPKYVVSIANIFANGEEYSPSMFSGGDETNSFFRGLGFTIVENEQSDESTLLNVPKSNNASLSLDNVENQLSKDLHRDMLNIYDESKAIGYTPSKFRQMVANEGGLKTAKKLINSKKLSDGFAELAQLGRLDLTVEALVVQKKYTPLFTDEELFIAKDRLFQLGYQSEEENNENDYGLPPLNSNGRVREYNFYSDELKGQVLYEHLINNKTHRWMDINVLGRTGNTNGRDSANILFYLGLRADYRGIFAEKSLDEVIEILKSKGEDFADIVRLLKVQAKSIQLYKNVKSDIEAQEEEEGNGIEGTKKSYYVNKYERDPKNRKKAIEIHGLNCCVCGFNFEKVYGERGKDFIEIHHINPLSTLEEAVVINPKSDLVPLCANCHRMIHRRKDDVLDVEDLRVLINQIKG